MASPARGLALLCAALTLPLSQLIFQGCAVGPTQEEYARWDRGPKLSVYIDGKFAGNNDLYFQFSQRGRHHVRLERAGCRPADILVEIPWENTPIVEAKKAGPIAVTLWLDPDTGIVSRSDFIHPPFKGKYPYPGQSDDRLNVQIRAAKYQYGTFPVGRLECVTQDRSHRGHSQ